MTTTYPDPRPEEWGVSPDEARRLLLEQQTCPVCGEGPWISPLNHVAKKHGISRLVMRDICLLSMVEKVTDPAARDAWIENGKGKRDVLLQNADAMRGTRRPRGRETAAARRALADNPLAAWIDANPSEAAALRAGFRDRMTTPEALIAWRDAMTPVWTNAERRAAQAKRMAEGQAAFMNDRPRPPVPLCSVEGCERKHAAKGMCKMHWARSRTSGRIGRPRALTEAQMADVRTRCAGGLSQRAVADQFGVTQSIVSRVVRGCYIDTA